MTNAGTAPVTITSVVVDTGDFSQTNDCIMKSPLAPGHACTINIVFQPNGLLSRTGSLRINNDGLISSRIINLTGTGEAINDFSITLTPGQQSTVAGNDAGFTINTAVIHGVAEQINLSANCGGLKLQYLSKSNPCRGHGHFDSSHCHRERS